MLNDDEHCRAEDIGGNLAGPCTCSRCTAEEELQARREIAEHAVHFDTETYAVQPGLISSPFFGVTIDRPRENTAERFEIAGILLDRSDDFESEKPTTDYTVNDLSCEEDVGALRYALGEALAGWAAALDDDGECRPPSVLRIERARIAELVAKFGLEGIIEQ